MNKISLKINVIKLRDRELLRFYMAYKLLFVRLSIIHLAGFLAKQLLTQWIQLIASEHLKLDKTSKNSCLKMQCPII